jgi:nucleotide-binding universal stress UspA family protein
VGLNVVRHARCPVVVHRPGDHRGRVHQGVLVAADAMPGSRPVLDFAFRMASTRRLPLKVVHYVNDLRSAHAGVPMSGQVDELTEEHRLALAESLAGYREDYPEVHLSIETQPGRVPDEGLARLSRAADLTVVGTHQRTTLDRVLVGSVSEGVLGHSVGPVAIVPMALSRTS